MSPGNAKSRYNKGIPGLDKSLEKKEEFGKESPRDKEKEKNDQSKNEKKMSTSTEILKKEKEKEKSPAPAPPKGTWAFHEAFKNQMRSFRASSCEGRRKW